MELSDEMVEVVPKPLSSLVLINNPLYGKMDEMQEELDKLPPEAAEEYMRENIYSLVDRVKVIDVGPDARGINPGDELTTTMSSLEGAIKVCDEKYLLVRSSSFYAVWAKQ